MGEPDQESAAELMLYLAASPSPAQAKKIVSKDMLEVGGSPVQGRRLFVDDAEESDPSGKTEAFPSVGNESDAAMSGSGAGPPISTTPLSTTSAAQHLPREGSSVEAGSTQDQLDETQGSEQREGSQASMPPPIVPGSSRQRPNGIMESDPPRSSLAPPAPQASTPPSTSAALASGLAQPFDPYAFLQASPNRSMADQYSHMHSAFAPPTPPTGPRHHNQQVVQQLEPSWS
jgi:hypothetical protein